MPADDGLEPLPASLARTWGNTETMEGRMSEIQDGPTRFGFRWGPMDVERLAHVEGRGYCIEVRTGHKRMQVYVTEAGRKIEAMEVRDV